MLKYLVEGNCRLCPRNCKANRSRGRGLCKTSSKLEIASFNLHFGEEPPISGKNGSGTIFFAGCNMGCIYCQNYPISQLKSAFREVEIDELADIMIRLQKRGAHNINFVTPSHFAHLLVDAIELARSKGLSIPIVYNTSSYDKEEVIYALEGYVDVYLGDLKYTDDKLSMELSGVNDYFDVATRALKAMFNTKGRLVLEDGIAKQGLIVRHLVLPGCIENSKKALLWIRDNLPDVDVSVMFQYFPAYKAFLHPLIKRKISPDEYFEIVDFVHELGLKGYIQQV
ncbi:radical SAM protein [Hippea sp. KM1]|uniref:radical SAM protein n=1 Tax=Hippea sp. KM1 TaxID=944481 RepID=UPI00046D20DD|nr:radical SAM protein [Hippea sp. KM1]